VHFRAKASATEREASHTATPLIFLLLGMGIDVEVLVKRMTSQARKVCDCSLFWKCRNLFRLGAHPGRKRCTRSSLRHSNLFYLFLLHVSPEYAQLGKVAHTAVL